MSWFSWFSWLFLFKTIFGFIFHIFKASFQFLSELSQFIIINKNASISLLYVFVINDPKLKPYNFTKQNCQKFLSTNLGYARVSLKNSSNFFYPVNYFFPVNNFFPCQVLNFFPVNFWFEMKILRMDRTWSSGFPTSQNWHWPDSGLDASSFSKPFD